MKILSSVIILTMSLSFGGGQRAVPASSRGAVFKWYVLNASGLKSLKKLLMLKPMDTYFFIQIFFSCTCTINFLLQRLKVYMVC